MANRATRCAFDGDGPRRERGHPVESIIRCLERREGLDLTGPGYRLGRTTRGGLWCVLWRHREACRAISDGGEGTRGLAGHPGSGDSATRVPRKVARLTGTRAGRTRVRWGLAGTSGIVGPKIRRSPVSVRPATCAGRFVYPEPTSRAAQIALTAPRHRRNVGSRAAPSGSLPAAEPLVNLVPPPADRPHTKLDRPRKRSRVHHSIEGCLTQTSQAFNLGEAKYSWFHL